MTKTYKPIPVKDYGVVVDDNKITKGYYVDYDTKLLTLFNGEITYEKDKRIIGSIGKRLDGIPLIELADTIMPLARKSAVMNNYDVNNDTYKHGFVIGHKANTNKYSEEDMLQFAAWYNTRDFPDEMTYINRVEEWQSLQKQPIPTEVELELEEKTSEQIQKELGIYGHDEGLTEKEYQEFIKHNSVVKIHNKETNTITAVNYK